MSQDKEQLQALLADYVEGSLSERQIDEAEAYLAANPAVRTVVDRLMIDSEALRALPRQRALVDFSEDFRAQAERDLLLGDAVSATRVPRSFGGPMMALAAMLAIGLGLGGAGYYLLAYRPTTNLEFAKVAARRVASPEASTASSRDESNVAAAPPTSEPAVDAAAPAAPMMTETAPTMPAPMTPAPSTPAAVAPPREEDGKAWDRVFAAKPKAADARADDATAQHVEASAKTVEATAQKIEASALPDDVRAAIASRASSRGAVVIVVDDPATLDATRSLVRAAIAEATENNVAAKASNRAEAMNSAGAMNRGDAMNDAAGGAGPGGATTAPTAAAAVASDVSPAAVGRVRALFGDATARVYDVPATDAAPTQQPQAIEQQASGVFRERAAMPVDVYVIARASATTTRATE